MEASGPEAPFRPIPTRRNGIDQNGQGRLPLLYVMIKTHHGPAQEAVSNGGLVNGRSTWYLPAPDQDVAGNPVALCKEAFIQIVGWRQAQWVEVAFSCRGLQLKAATSHIKPQNTMSRVNRAESKVDVALDE